MRLPDANSSNKYQKTSPRRDHRNLIVQTMLRQSEPVSIAQLAASVQLSKTALSTIINGLVKDGLVDRFGKGRSTEEGGKKPMLFGLNPSHKYCITVTLDSTYCIGELKNFRLETIDTTSETFSTPLDYDPAVRIVVSVVKSLLGKNHLSKEILFGIVICTGGIVDVTNGILRDPVVKRNRKWGRDLPLKDDIERKLGFKTNIYYDNSSRYLGFAEIITSAERRDYTIAVIFTNENTGGCLIRNGMLVYGDYGLVGEYGQIITGEDTNTFETAIAPDTLIRIAKNACATFPHSTVADKLRKNTFSTDDFFIGADAGDPLACEVLDYAVQHFSVLIRNLQLMCNPSEVVIEGMFGADCNYFRKQLKKSCKLGPQYRSSPLKISYVQGNIILRSHIGAAYYCFEKYLENV